MIALTMLWMTSTSLALDPAILRSPTGWRDIGQRKTEFGTAQLWSQSQADAQCVRAAMEVAVSVDRLLEVAADIPSAARWSTQDLVVSEVLSRDGTTLDYWQYLDAPTWLSVADRYWVVRGQRHTQADHVARFTWSTLPATAHPDVDTHAHARSDRAIRVPLTIGEWTFEPRGQATWTTYTNCVDPGGRLPDWVVRVASTRTVPDNLADLVREALARDGT